MNCLFSIIIPVFNSEYTIKNCIKSILNQRFKDFEIIFIDNQSTDQTLPIINEFSNPRFKLISEKDRGVYDAMNKGLKLAKGDWIYFMGGDDLLYDEIVLESISKEIQSTRFPVIYGSVKINGDTGWAKDGEIYAGYFSKNRMLKKAICHQSIFYNRKFLIQNNLSFNLDYFVSADWDFNLRCRRISEFKYLDRMIAIFNAGGISSTNEDSFQEKIKSEFSDLFPSEFEVFAKKVGKIFISFFR